MKRNGFIKATRFDEKLIPEDRKADGTYLINLEEIVLVICGNTGSIIILKDYATKLFVLESEKEIQLRINAAKGGDT